MALSVVGLFACSDQAVQADMGTTDAADVAPLSKTIVEVDPLDPYAAFAATLAHHQAMSERVERISHRLRVANAPLCSVTRLDAGLSTHRLNDYPVALHPLALHFMDIEEDGRFIRSVVPGSPADKVDIRKGEKVVSGWPIQADKPLILSNGSGAAPVRVDPQPACVAPAFVINSNQPNASTDGREIELSTALIEQVGDDSGLAFIIAHEMAHVLRQHRPDGPRWKAELQADGDALTLMRNAGYDISSTVSAWEAGVEAHRETQSMSATHPPVQIRLNNLEATLARIQSGPEGFLPLED